MTARIFHILAFLLLWGFPAMAAEVVVVQGERLAPFEAALRGFEGEARVRSTERIVLDEMRGGDVVRAVREARPRLVLAIGRDALARVKDIREIPVVYLMVTSPAATGATGRNVTGVTMAVPPERSISFIRNELNRKRVGLLFDPEESAALAGQVRQAAERHGVTLITREAGGPREAVRQLASLKGKVDALLLVPDKAVLSGDALEAIFLFSQENRVPVVAFAGKYLRHGALAAFELDPADMGRQAGRMARHILDGTPVERVAPELPAKAALKVNQSVARHLGIHLDLPGE